MPPRSLSSWKGRLIKQKYVIGALFSDPCWLFYIPYIGPRSGKGGFNDFSKFHKNAHLVIPVVQDLYLIYFLRVLKSRPLIWWTIWLYYELLGQRGLIEYYQTLVSVSWEKDRNNLPWMTCSFSGHSSRSSFLEHRCSKEFIDFFQYEWGSCSLSYQLGILCLAHRSL